MSHGEFSTPWWLRRPQGLGGHHHLARYPARPGGAFLAFKGELSNNITIPGPRPHRSRTTSPGVRHERGRRSGPGHRLHHGRQPDHRPAEAGGGHRAEEGGRHRRGRTPPRTRSRSRSSWTTAASSSRTAAPSWSRVSSSCRTRRARSTPPAPDPVQRPGVRHPADPPAAVPADAAEKKLEEQKPSWQRNEKKLSSPASTARSPRTAPPH
ncbi:hypothetical protein QJS66_12730 [Kocuria rhizophila]|nr:hypothetical protein QJS66_12730 [Kocuria rhizophila]